MSTTKMITDAIKDASKAKTKAYDTTATVKRVEGSTVWVHIPGGVDETPVKRTINANIGDTVQVRVSDGSAWLVGNASAPPTDDTRANSAMVVATDANALAESASKAATEAWGYAEDARSAAATAETHANEAKASAENASEYAARALGNLSTVQNVSETLNWITAHGTMTLTTDVALDPTHVYFVVDPLGDYEVSGTHYSVVTEPDVTDIGTYYELSIDESLNNYVGTHLALTSEGLWLVPEAGGNKVLIAVGGQGHRYEDAGTYIIDENDNIMAKFLSSSAQIGKNSGSHSVLDTDGQRFYATDGTTQLANIGYGEGTAESGIETAPYYTFGIRNMTIPDRYDPTVIYGLGALCVYDDGNGDKIYIRHYPETGPGEWNPNYWTYYIGNYSLAEGINNISAGWNAHAEGSNTAAIGYKSHAEGQQTIAARDFSHAEGWKSKTRGIASHAEGDSTYADGQAAHAQNTGTRTVYDSQTALGKYNDTSVGNVAVMIGNGGANKVRSNALTVDWSGDVCLALDTTAQSGTDYDLYTAITALGWQNDVIV